MTPDGKWLYAADWNVGVGTILKKAKSARRTPIWPFSVATPSRGH